MILKEIKEKINKFIINSNPCILLSIEKLIKKFITLYYPDIEMNEILTYQTNKREFRGGFDKKIFCYLFIMNKYDPDIEYFKKNENKYKPVTMHPHINYPDSFVFGCNKLVRDKVITEGLEEIFYRQLNNQEFHTALLNKLQEEFLELEKAITREEIIEEVSDIFEVLSYLQTIK